MHAKVALQIALLVVSGIADAHSTNALHKRFDVRGYYSREWNPAVSPFVGHGAIYAAIPAGDVAIYLALRRTHHPKAAKWFLRIETAENFACAICNSRQRPRLTTTSPAATPALTK